MPLIVGTLQGELIAALDKGPAGNPSPQLVGLDIAKAYMNFCSTGMNVGAGSFTAMPGASALGQDLGNILGGSSPSGTLTAQKMATAFDTCLQTFLSVYQNSIVTTAGLPLLQGELMQVFSSPAPSATLFAQSFASALNNYTLAAIVIGIIPGTPPIPFTGPIS
jgi:hypothetical protein